MRRTLITLSLILSICGLSLVACAPAAMEKNKPDTQIKFEPTLQDRELPWDKIEASQERWFFPRGKSFVLSGARLMNTFENMMYLGDSLNDLGIRLKAHDLVKNFYATRSTTTNPKVEESLYLEAALGEKKTVLFNLLRKKLAELNDSLPALDRTVQKIKASTANLNAVPLSGLAPFLQTMLDNFVTTLEAEGASKMVWKEFRNTVDQQYRSQITEVSQALAQVSADKKVSDNTKLMRVILKLPLEAGTLKKIERQLNSVDDIAKRLEVLDSSYEGMRLLLDIWLLLDNEGRQKTFKQMSGALYFILARESDDYIVQMRENSNWNWWPKQIAIRRGLQGILSMYGVQKIKDKILPELRKSVPVALETSLRKEIAKLPDMISGIVKDKVATKIQDIKGHLSTAANTRKVFVEMSVKWGKKEIFEGQDATIGLEKDRYVVQVNEAGDYTFSPDASVSSNSTTASVLGASFSMSAKRFDRVTEFESITYDSQGYYQMVIAMLNKILALGGFTKIDDQTYPSFHVLKNGRDVFERQLEIKTQVGSPYYFVVPDYIALNPPFKMDNARTAGLGLQFSVSGQSELLRGLSHTVEFFRDWKVNGFDVKMSRFILGELIPDLPPHLHNEALFPKEKLFEYCLGISSFILENLKREGSNLVLFDDQGKVYFGNEIEDAKKAQALMAAMVDVKVNERDDTIRTADVSRFILAMSKFVNAMEGFEASKSSALHKLENGEEKRMKELRKSLQNVRLLMALMSNFLVHKMRRADGTMDSFYSLKVGKVISVSRSLEDQLLAIQALLTAGETLGMGSYLGSAYDVYFGLNRVFFRDDKGFYSASDRSWKQPDSYQFSELMSALTHLSKKTDFSRGQISRLIGQFRDQLAH